MPVGIHLGRTDSFRTAVRTGPDNRLDRTVNRLQEELIAGPLDGDLVTDEFLDSLE
jgi:hypothetical protein